MHKLGKEAVEMLWNHFDVPINDHEEIDDDWCGWERLTPREEIWHWFDEQYARYGGVYALMFPDERKGERSSADLMEARRNAYRRHYEPGVPSAHVYD